MAPTCLVKDRCLRHAKVFFFLATICPSSTLLRANPSAASNFRLRAPLSKLTFLGVLGHALHQKNTKK
jgi:hypothetical protein